MLATYMWSLKIGIKRKELEVRNVMGFQGRTVARSEVSCVSFIQGLKPHHALLLHIFFSNLFSLWKPSKRQSSTLYELGLWFSLYFSILQSALVHECVCEREKQSVRERKRQTS